MSSFCVRDCGWWYRAVESHESAAFFNSQAEQIDIGKISRCEHSSRLETTRVAQGDGIWPEDVISGRNRCRKPAHSFRDGQVTRIVWLRNHSDASVLRDWTRCPADRAIFGHPRMRGFVMHVGSVEESDKHIDIKQCDHGSFDSSRSFRTSSGVTIRSAAGKISNPFRCFVDGPP